MKVSFFVVCAPGLESIVRGELDALGIRTTRTVRGGIECSGSERDLYLSNAALRCASRVLVRLSRFRCTSFPELAKAAGRVPWAEYIPGGTPVTVRADSTRSKLYHTGGIADSVREGMGDAASAPPSPEEGTGISVFARIDGDVCTLSIDSSGEHLHRRGYRLESGKAPLRETTASAMIVASGWDGTSPLVDPLCGSGTIPIEAALAGSRKAPGLSREFGFMRWPSFNRGAWASVRASLAARGPENRTAVLGFDRDEGAVRAAAANAGRAGVGSAVSFSEAPLSSLQVPAGPGTLITNPPYGVRVSEGRELRKLYSAFGDVVRARCADWRVVFITNDDGLARATGLPLKTAFATSNGGIAVTCYVTV